jgi:two-component system C4-dicarboxylate transport sensor histidine kinase DctB
MRRRECHLENSSAAADSTWPPRRLAAAVLASLLGLLLVIATGLWVGRWFADDARAELLRRTEAAAALRNATLTSELEKHRSLPTVLAQDDDVRAALGGHDPAHVQALNRKLEVLSAETRSAAIYVVNHAGTTIAASNWREPSSFVGSNYSFRPYFRDALSAGYAEMFALGTVSQSPGLYLARRVTPGASADTGVIVVKVSFDALEAQWSAAGEHAFVTDARGVVLITSVPTWRFSTLGRLDSAEIASLRQSLQYGSDAALQPLPFAIDAGAAESTAGKPPFPGARQFAAARVAVPVADWTLHVLAPADHATEAARSAGRLLGAFAAALALAGLLLFAILRERARMRDATREQLETQVAARTKDLKEANERLVHEMEERRRTEAQIHLLQDELIQANKLTVLGQVAAGVAHEINQPVAAIRSFVDNATELLARGSLPTVQENLAAVVGLTERIGLITQELRSFARKSTGALALVDVNKALDGALLMLAARLRSAGVRLDRGASDCVTVLAERVRLEQVVINLLQNAIDALSGHPSPVIELRVEVDEGQVRLVVADNGPGLPQHVIDALFQPFVTTKSQGLGLGLVISRDIVAEFGGALELARSGPEGATFVVTLLRQA